MTHYQPIMSRRQTLAWLSVTLGSLMLPRLSPAVGGIAEKSGYGQDPPFDVREAPWPRVLTPAELNQLAALADLLLPAGSDTPAPSRIGIPDFLDEWVSAPYPRQVQDRALIRSGLEALDTAALSQTGLIWSAAPESTQMAILAEFASPDGSPGSTVSAPKRGFFVRVRQLVISAYYTTPSGMRAVGYVGNVALAAYPGVTGELDAELNRRMQQLGL